MRKLLLVSILISFTLGVQSQWRSSDIPDSLKKNADVVVRRMVTDYNIVNKRKIVLSEKVVLTILNEKGRKYANFSEYYDKDSQIEYFKGIIYDDNGKITKKIYKPDLIDQSMVSDFSLYEDNRILFNEVYPLSYPFTVEYEYRKVVNSAMFIPSWYPQIGYRIGLQDASLRVSYPSNNPLRYKTFNISAPSSSNENGDEKLMWVLRNIKPMEYEPYTTSSHEYFASVIMSATFFELSGYDGAMDSWNSYGRWLEKLQDGRRDLSLECQNKMIELVKGESDLKRKVSIIYKFMQSQTRYVSIQLGVGGWQPFPASSVEKNGYGDCKALANYTRSLLEVVGIKSYYCPIGVNGHKIRFNDFPGANQTNHIILCVPLVNDTLWLECTSQRYPFNYIPHEYQNQKVVLVDGDSSRLVNLPRADAAKNKQVRTMIVQIDSIGNATGEINTVVYGAELENLIPEIWSSKKDQNTIIQKKYSMPGISFGGYEYKYADDVSPFASEKLKFSVVGLASVTGRRFFMPINLFGSQGSLPTKIKKRLTDMEIDECYSHFDTLVYNIPNGYELEYLPNPKSLKGIFGSFDISVKKEDDKLIVARRYQLNRNTYPASEYNNFVDFLSNITKADKQSIVLISKK